VTDFGIPRIDSSFLRGTRMTVAVIQTRDGLRSRRTDRRESDTPIRRPQVLKEGLPAGRHSGMSRTRKPSSGGLISATYGCTDTGSGTGGTRTRRSGAIDTLARTVYPIRLITYGIRRAAVHFLNVLEELDTPGEWALDRLEASCISGPRHHRGGRRDGVTVEAMSSLRAVQRPVSGVHVREFPRCAITIRGGSDNLIAGCTIRNIDNDTTVSLTAPENGYEAATSTISVRPAYACGRRQTTLTPGENSHQQPHHPIRGHPPGFNGGIFLQGRNIVSHNRSTTRPSPASSTTGTTTDRVQ